MLTIVPLFIPRGSEWLVLLVLFLVLFGGKKIPELMRGLGRGVKEFKDAVNKDYTAEEENKPAADKPQKPAGQIEG